MRRSFLSSRGCDTQRGGAKSIDNLVGTNRKRRRGVTKSEMMKKKEGEGKTERSSELSEQKRKGRKKRTRSPPP